MPLPDTFKKRDAFESKTMWGIFVGYHVAPGGLHTGGYLFAEYAALKNNIDAGMGQATYTVLKG